MTREEFMNIAYFELHSDGDNYRANRIIDAADEYAEDSSSDFPNKLIVAEVLDKIRAEIEHMIPCSKEALSIKLGVLEIIDKYKAESEG